MSEYYKMDLTWTEPIISKLNGNFRKTKYKKELFFELINSKKDNKHVGYLIITKKRNCQIILFDELENNDIPPEFLKSYFYNNSRIFIDWQVKSILQEMIVTPSRLNIRDILDEIGLEEYDTVDMAVATLCMTQKPLRLKEIYLKGQLKSNSYLIK